MVKTCKKNSDFRVQKEGFLGARPRPSGWLCSRLRDGRHLSMADGNDRGPEGHPVGAQESHGRTEAEVRAVLTSAAASTGTAELPPSLRVRPFTAGPHGANAVQPETLRLRT